MLGAREDGLEAFKRTLELADELRVGIHPVLATPLPGTELYEEYRPYLIPGLGWEAYTGVRAVFEHPDPEATPERREREYHQLVSEIFSARRIVDRLRAIPWAGLSEDAPVLADGAAPDEGGLRQGARGVGGSAGARAPAERREPLRAGATVGVTLTA